MTFIYTEKLQRPLARELNGRPRMTLNCYSPAEKFEECVAAIG
jgi:IS30 family transposase